MYELSLKAVKDFGEWMGVRDDEAYIKLLDLVYDSALFTHPYESKWTRRYGGLLFQTTPMAGNDELVNAISIPHGLCKSCFDIGKIQHFDDLEKEWVWLPCPFMHKNLGSSLDKRN